MPLWREKPSLAPAGVTLTDGGEFPREADRNRIALYAILRKLRYDEHDDVFPRVQSRLERLTGYVSDRWAGLTYVQGNLLGALARDNADRLFLGPLKVEAKDAEDGQSATQDALEYAMERSRFRALGLDAVDMGSTYGDVAVKAIPSPEGARLDLVDPSLILRGEDYFPEYAEANPDPRIHRFPMVARPVRLAGGSYAVLFEIHEPGYVLFRAYRWSVRDADLREMPSFADEGLLGDQVDVSQAMPDAADYETGLEDPTLIVWANDRGPSLSWGWSDFTPGLRSIQDEINHELSLLCAHAERLMAGGITVLPLEMKASLRRADSAGSRATDYGRGTLRQDEQSSYGSVVMPRRECDLVFEHGETQGVTRYVSETPHFEQAFGLLQMLVASFERLSRFSVGAIMGQESAPESGRALRYKQASDMVRVARKQVRYTEPLQRALQMVLALDGVAAELPSLQWPDPFPLSELDKAELIEVRTAGKASMARKTALMRVDGFTATEAEAEIEAIDEETQEPTPIGGVGDFAAARRGPTPDFGPEPGGEE
jgi:hypothetical protein